MSDLMERPITNQRFPVASVQVHQAVEALPAVVREVLLLVCVKGLSYQDAAQKIGISRGAVINHLLRGRSTLIRELSLEGAGDHDAVQAIPLLSS